MLRARDTSPGPPLRQLGEVRRRAAARIARQPVGDGSPVSAKPFKISMDRSSWGKLRLHYSTVDPNSIVGRYLTAVLRSIAFPLPIAYQCPGADPGTVSRNPISRYSQPLRYPRWAPVYCTPVNGLQKAAMLSHHNIGCQQRYAGSECINDEVAETQV